METGVNYITQKDIVEKNTTNNKNTLKKPTRGNPRAGETAPWQLKAMEDPKERNTTREVKD